MQVTERLQDLGSKHVQFKSRGFPTPVLGHLCRGVDRVRHWLGRRSPMQVDTLFSAQFCFRNEPIEHRTKVQKLWNILVCTLQYIPELHVLCHSHHYRYYPRPYFLFTLSMPFALSLLRYYYQVPINRANVSLNYPGQSEPHSQKIAKMMKAVKWIAGRQWGRGEPLSISLSSRCGLATRRNESRNKEKLSNEKQQQETIGAPDQTENPTMSISNNGQSRLPCKVVVPANATLSLSVRLFSFRKFTTTCSFVYMY